MSRLPRDNNLSSKRNTFPARETLVLLEFVDIKLPLSLARSQCDIILVLWMSEWQKHQQNDQIPANNLVRWVSISRVQQLEHKKCNFINCKNSPLILVDACVPHSHSSYIWIVIFFNKTISVARLACEFPQWHTAAFSIMRNSDSDIWQGSCERT